MDKRIALNEDPRYLDFVARYARDAYRFAVEVIGVKPSQQQKVMMNLVSQSGSRVSVSSGHGTGKSFSLSIITLWHLLTHYMSWTLITANTFDQVKASTLKELAKHIGLINRGPHAWIHQHIELMAEGTVRIRGYAESWKVEIQVANRKNANKMAGRHAQWLMIIADEASTIPDEVMVTLRGALTEEGNRMLLTSQPTHNSGFFFDTHHGWAKANGGVWDSLTFSSFESPWTSDSALKVMWDQYDEDERRVRLMGLFPMDASKFFIGRRDVEKVWCKPAISPEQKYGYVICADIASGEGLRDKSAVVVAKVWGYANHGDDARRVDIIDIPLYTNNIRSNTFANYLAEIGSKYSNVTYCVDSGGLGINVCQDLEDMGKNIIRINWGNPCFRNENRERYLNLRAQATHQMARAMKEGRLTLQTHDYRNVVLDQCSRIPKAFTEKGKLKVPQKHSAEWEGMGSPDLADAIAFTMLESTTYMPSEGALDTSENLRTALQVAEDEFADVE